MRRFLQIVLALVLLCAGATMWYLYRKGFSKSWREWLVDELRNRGVEVSFTKLTVEPFRGLVAKDVRIYQNASRKRVLAKVDEIVVEANYAHAARGEPFLNALTLVDASLDLPLDPKKPDGPAVRVEKLNTRLHLPPKQLLVARLEAEVFGVRIKAAGQLANPLFTKATPPTPPGPTGESPLARAVQELRSLRYEGPPPELRLRFSGDMMTPESLVIEADFRGEKIRRGNYRLEALAASAVWQNQSRVISQFDARDVVGRLQLSASYQAPTGQAECRVRSGMNLPALLRASQLLDFGEFKFESVPDLEFTARATLPDIGRPLKFQALGHVRVGRCQYGGTPLQRVNADFSWDGQNWAARDVHILHANGGELRLDAQQRAGPNAPDFRLGLKSNLNPETLAPLFQARFKGLAKLLAQFRFYDAPQISLSARGPSPLDCAASGDLVLGKCSYRGVEALSARANLRYNGRVLSVDDFLLKRQEGIGGGALAFDLQAGTCAIRQVRCALFPTEAALWIDPDLVGDLRPYRIVKNPPMLLIDGIVDMRKPPRRTKLDITLNAPVIDYTFCGKDLHFQDVTGKLNFVDGRMKMTDIRAELFGGTMKGDADISLLKSKPGHAAQLEFEGINFSKLTKLYFDYDESQGKLSGHYNFTGAGDDGRVMRGDGQLTVMEGHVFAIPFLGPFSEILNKLVPGMGYQKARRASATFSIAGGFLETKDFVIEGRGFSMIGDGKIGFLDDRLDFDMRLNAQGLPGVLLFPVSKLLEYETRGKFSKPAWRAKIIPKFGGNEGDSPNPQREANREQKQSNRPALARPPR